MVLSILLTSWCDKRRGNEGVITSSGISYPVTPRNRDRYYPGSLQLPAILLQWGNIVYSIGIGILSLSMCARLRRPSLSLPSEKKTDSGAPVQNKEKNYAQEELRFPAFSAQMTENGKLSGPVPFLTSFRRYIYIHTFLHLHGILFRNILGI